MRVMNNFGMSTSVHANSVTYTYCLSSMHSVSGGFWGWQELGCSLPLQMLFILPAVQRYGCNASSGKPFVRGEL